ncbi:hypothetical protein [Herbaspirillum rubrisubalbicans]|uniref:hypothetical protein n=1 Tax=Herbaspirillum rubrisubalbicans TaxID=80842 RepID=UPI0015C55BA4|nr:hypothetical protein [Herbaspirillum rubrisubalbicans]NQE49690.1 hypothetical protein [Herbaspirillum rubrisubalbicans]
MDSSNANTSDPNLRSYTVFDRPSAAEREVALMQQFDGSNVLGTWLNLGLENRIGSPTEKDLYLKHLGSFSIAGRELYQVVTPFTDKSRTGIDLANIGLLYQYETSNANKTPTLQVSYDGSRAAVGDVVALYEGNTVLARKVLTSADLGAGNKTINLTVAQSLSAGDHDIVARYTDTAGNIVNAAAQRFSVPAGGDTVTLTDLAVRSNKQGVGAAQALNSSESAYAVLSDMDTSQVSGHTPGGPVFTGKVGGGRGGSSDRYVVTIEMGGKLLAFDEVAAGDFSISLPVGSLPPGLYRDLNITASLSSGSNLGQSTTVQGLKLGWYWAGIATGDIVAGGANDEIMLGETRSSTTMIQTGAGDDKIIVGSFGRTENLIATVGDFVLGVDKVQVFNQTITQANLSSFVKAGVGPTPTDTRLLIDLDGAGPGTLTYTLTLQNVLFNSANTATIFGV